MSNSKKLSVSRIKNLILLYKFIVSQKYNNKTICISFLNENSIDEISEYIYNILYNKNLNTKLPKSQKAKLRKIIHPNSRSFEEISKRKVPVKMHRSKIIQQGLGIETVILTLMPVLTSLSAKQ